MFQSFAFIEIGLGWCSRITIGNTGTGGLSDKLNPAFSGALWQASASLGIHRTVIAQVTGTDQCIYNDWERFLTPHARLCQFYMSMSIDGAEGILRKEK